MAADETAQPSVPMASIRAYLDRQLEVVTIEDGYELRYGDQPLGWLGDPKFAGVVEAVTRDGTWWFTRSKRGDTAATEPRDGADPIATYKSGLVPGGTIQLPDETRLKLRPPVTGETWKVRSGARERVLEIRAPRGPWEIEFAAAAREIYYLPLLTMFAFHAMLVEVDRPGAGAASDGGIGF